MKWQSYIFAAIACGAITAHSATINWTGGGDGVNWGDPANWSAGAVPTSGDDAVLGPGAAVTIYGDSFYAASVQSQRDVSITAGASLNLSAGDSEIKGSLNLGYACGLNLNGATATFLCTNAVSADYANLYAQNGGQLHLTGLKRVSKPDGYCGNNYWFSTGSGSVLDLSSVTNIYPGNCAYLSVEAMNGGSIILSNVVTMTNGYFQAYADGSNSVMDLSNLASFPAQYGWFDLTALNGGQVIMPLLSDGLFLGLTLRNGGVADTAQFTRIGSVTVDNQPLVLPAVTNIDNGAYLSVNNGGSLSLPLLKFFNKQSSYCDVYWQASGSNSVLNLSSLTNITWDGGCGYLRAQSFNGGQLILSNVLAVTTNTMLQAYADGDGSVIDLSELAAFPSGTGWMDLQARNGGQVIMPLLVDGSRANFTLVNGGVMNLAQLKLIGGISVDNQTVTLSGVTNIDGSVNMYVTHGGRLALPLIKSYTKSDGCYDVYWYASDADSVLDLSSLTNVPYFGNGCGYIRAQSFNGAQITLSNLLAVPTNTFLQAFTDGAGCVIDFRKLRVFPDATGWMDLQARDGAQIIMPLLVDGSHAGFTLAGGGIMDIAQLKRVGAFSVDSQAVTLPAVTNLDGAVSLYVNGGGSLSVPLVRSYSKPDGCYDVYWYATGAGSVLDLSSITNIPFISSNNCGYIRARATDGGTVLLSNLLEVATNTSLEAYAEGAGSVIDLSKLAVFPEATGWLDLQARDGGQVIIPLLVDGSRSAITIVGAGVMNTAQLTRVNYVYVENASLTLPAVTNADSGTALYAYYGAHLSLPQLGTLTKTNGCYDTYWYAYGAGSVLDLSALTNVIYSGDCGYLRMQAYYGAQIIASNLVAVPDGSMQAYSYSTDGQGTNSLIDLRKLSSFSTTDGWFDLTAYGGVVMVPLLADGHRVGLTISTGGTVDTAQFTRLGALYATTTTNTFPALTNLDGSLIYLYGGAKITFPALTSVTKVPICSDERWQVNDAGSQLVAPALTTIASQDTCAGFDFETRNGGLLVLSNVSSIAGPYINISADGSGSTIDLTRLNSFIAPNGTTASLTAQNDGVLLLGSDAFLLADISVNIPPGNPLLPPVFIAGPNLSLYGQPWHSYLIEDRTTLIPNADWQLFERVPQTNTFQIVGGPPAANTAFRVSELFADPSVLEISALPGQRSLLLFGLANHTFQIETTTNLCDASSWTSYSTFAMTNTFHFFDSLNFAGRERYFRARTP